MSSMLHDLFKPGFSTSKPGDIKNNSFITSVMNAPLIDPSSIVRLGETFGGSFGSMTSASTATSSTPLDRDAIAAMAEAIKFKPAPKIERDVPQTVEDSW